MLTDDEIRAFWRALDGLSPETAGFWRLRLLTAQRGGEVQNMRWCDLRRTAASRMTSAGISRLVVSKVLNHVERGVTAGARGRT